MRVIDVSKYNGGIAWHKVVKNCDGAIIRAGYRGYGSGKLVTDTKFKANIDAAKAAGVPIGVYFVTQAVNETEARQEARYTMELVKGYSLSFPIFIDSEDGNNGAGRADHCKLSKFNRTAILKAFCDEIEKEGYIAGIYASEYWFRAYLDINMLTKYYLWVAKYSTKKPSIVYNAWQYTDAGKIDGISGRVDISDFTPIKTAKKSSEEVAEEVLAGKWGNGEERKKALEAAGYNYRSVQDIVNQKVKERG
jgi:GH25 family lysozyme M1 (1,4-beta-N-acetylmuramidase)